MDVTVPVTVTGDVDIELDDFIIDMSDDELEEFGLIRKSAAPDPSLMNSVFLTIHEFHDAEHGLGPISVCTKSPCVDVDGDALDAITAARHNS